MHLTPNVRQIDSLLHGMCVFAVVLVVGWAVGGCDVLGTSSAEQSGTVQMAFEAVSGSDGGSAGKQAATTDLEISGSNGTLNISRLTLVVGEFELEGSDHEGEGPEDSGEESEGTEDEEAERETDEFERGPFWTNVPLDGSAVEVTAGEVPSGVYEELSFEVEDLEDDEDEGERDDRIRAIRTELESEFSTWPQKASMVAVGTFTPTDGSAREFTTFFEAEIEIEQALSPPLEISGDASPQQATVRIDPERWFTRADGSVRDLSAFDYGTSGELFEFEVGIEEGFAETEIEEEFEDEDDEEDDGDEEEDDDEDQ